MSDLISMAALLKAFKVHGFQVVDEWRVIEHLITNAPTIEQNVKCSSHPDAPHGFCRDASHTANRYVCECEGWTLPSQPQKQGEPVAEIRFDELGRGYAQLLNLESFDTKKTTIIHNPILLYTAPPQPQTVKDALEKALKCTHSAGSDGRSEDDCIDEGVDFGSFEKGFSEAVDIISNRIRALIEKE